MQMSNGVLPLLFAALGLSVKGAKILTISVCPVRAAQWIGVFPQSFGALGLSVKGTKILTISVCPLHAAQWIGRGERVTRTIPQNDCIYVPALYEAIQFKVTPYTKTTTFQFTLNACPGKFLIISHSSGILQKREKWQKY